MLLRAEAVVAGTGFGVTAEAGPYLATKGIRDIGSGLVGLTLLATRHFRAAGWTIIVMAVVGAILIRGPRREEPRPTRGAATSPGGQTHHL